MFGVLGVLNVLNVLNMPMDASLAYRALLDSFRHHESVCPSVGPSVLVLVIRSVVKNREMEHLSAELVAQLIGMPYMRS